MLKLLKYELLESYRQYFLTFGLFFAGCLLIPLLPDSIQSIMGGFLITFLAIAVLSILVNIVYTFNTSMYQKSGYLTLTLPMSTQEIIVSKLVGAIIWSIVGSIVFTIGMILLSYLSSDIAFHMEMSDLQQLLEVIGRNIGNILLMIIALLTNTAVLILSFYFIVTLTHTKYIPKYKAACGVLIYILGSLAISKISDISGFDNWLATLSGTPSLIVTSIVAIIFSIIFFVGIVYLINNKIEVE